jgi:hypothetical protein
MFKRRKKPRMVARMEKVPSANQKQKFQKTKSRWYKTSREIKAEETPFPDTLIRHKSF